MSNINNCMAMDPSNSNNLEQLAMKGLKHDLCIHMVPQ